MSTIKAARGHPVALAVSLAALVGASVAAAKNWSEWSAAANLNTMSSPGLNTASIDGCASHSPDGLTIVFNSNRGGNHDLYTASRESRSDGFGAAVPLPGSVNTSANEVCPTLANGRRLYFSSDRHDPSYDIYVSRMGKTGWGAPSRLGPNINTNGMLEEAPDFYEDEAGREVMVFTRRNGPGTQSDIFQSIEGAPAELVQGGPHTSAADARASVTKDGLTMFWDSTRTGTLGGPDLYYATRSNTSQPFGSAIHLVSLSSPGFDARPFISWDGSFLTFASGRVGNVSPAPDMWIATRSKVTGR
jgi:hypothetical protein